MFSILHTSSWIRTVRQAGRNVDNSGRKVGRQQAVQVVQNPGQCFRTRKLTVYEQVKSRIARNSKYLILASKKKKKVTGIF